MPLPPTDSPLVVPQFEHELPPEALNEQRPRITAIDYLVQTSKFVICLEAKRGVLGELLAFVTKRREIAIDFPLE